MTKIQLINQKLTKYNNSSDSELKILQLQKSNTLSHNNIHNNINDNINKWINKPINDNITNYDVINGINNVIRDFLHQHLNTSLHPSCDIEFNEELTHFLYKNSIH